MRFIADNLATIICGIIVATIVCASFVICGTHAVASTSPAPSVVIHAADGTERRVPLDQDQTITVTCDKGTNVIAIAHGSARMVEADCPHGYCLSQTPIDEAGEQLVCLPHKLWVEVVTPTGASSSMDVSAVTYAEESAEGVDLVAR